MPLFLTIDSLLTGHNLVSVKRLTMIQSQVKFWLTEKLKKPSELQIAIYYLSMPTARKKHCSARNSFAMTAGGTIWLGSTRILVMSSIVSFDWLD